MSARHTAPEPFERALRAALAAEGVAMAAPGRKGGAEVAVPATGTIAEGGRDVALTSVAGSLARKIMRGDATWLHAVCELEEAWSRCTGPDVPSLDAKVASMAGFLLRDAEIETPLGAVWRAPFGWDEGLDEGERDRLGLDVIRYAYGERWVRRHYVLEARTGRFIHKATGEAVSADVLLRRDVGPYVAFHHATRRQVDTILACEGLGRVEYGRVRPDLAPGVFHEPPYRCWNLWRGYAVQRVQGDVGRFLNLVNAMFPSAPDRNIVLSYLAHVVQRPGDKPMWCLLLVSEANGVGKGTLAQVMRDLFHPAYTAEITTAEVTSSFNDWIEGRVFVFLDEVLSSDRFDVTNKLKTLLTSTTVPVNRKHVPAFAAPNLAAFMLASNRLDALKLDRDDRRFCVLRIEDDTAAAIKKADPFPDFRAWWANPLARGAVLDWLLRFDLASVLPPFEPKGRAPITTAKLDMIELGAARWDAALTDALRARRHPFHRDVVTVRELAELTRIEGQPVTEARCREWAKGKGFRPLDRMRLPGGGRAALWIVRDAERWACACKQEVRAELARQASYESAAAEGARLAFGPEGEGLGGSNKKGKSTGPQAHLASKLLK